MKVFGFAGYSGSGKTTLIEKLIPRFTARGLSVSLIKNTHHNFDVDQPGKDSWRHRQAGASEVLLTCDTRWVLMHERRGAPDATIMADSHQRKDGTPRHDCSTLTLEDQLAVLSPCDLVLVEGFKQTPISKLEIHRPAHGKPPIWPENPSVVAVATNAASQLSVDCLLPTLDLDDPDAIAQFILDYLDRPC